MNLTSIGDLAQHLMQRTRSTQLKDTISVLTQELSSGQVSDTTTRLGGDFSYLTDIDRNMARLDAYSIAAREAALFTEAAQQNLTHLNDTATSLGAAILASTPSHLDAVRDTNATQARADLDAVIGALNGTAAGRSIFAGTRTDSAALADSETLLNALRTAVSGLSDAGDIRQAADDWFNDPAGFRAAIYTGSDNDLAPIEVGPGQKVTMPLRADDAAFRDLIKDVALAALSTDAALGLSVSTQNDLLLAIGESLFSVQDDLTGMQANVGFAQSRVDEASTRNESARTGLEYARNALLEADPFDTATRLEQAQFQLESLYSVTVRTSRLTLLSFLQ
ncbi:flagellin [Arenibacterium sp. CAU 1754]